MRLRINLFIRSGSVTADDIIRDVVFDHADPSGDDAYHGKYERFGDSGVAPMVEPLAVAATFKLISR